ncbi:MULTISPECIES: hypothetical protein [unclassified Lysobacter]|uniref:hypothetical protein n=1 Tax=unclassified Lysobacter TaxID=2635362 RepID=UPI0020B3C912|nr:hypothetical protein [Lysobacter sp. MMG2]
MKRSPLRAVLFATGLSLCTAAMAQDDVDAAALDLSVPQQRIGFTSTDPDVSYRNDPPGSWYGDHGRRTTLRSAQGDDPNDWRVHGSVEAGIGYSSRTGNANWQAANINLDKTYIDDEGDASHVNIDINVGRSEGALFGPGYYPAWEGYGPMGPGPRMQARPPFIR